MELKFIPITIPNKMEYKEELMVCVMEGKGVVKEKCLAN